MPYIWQFIKYQYLSSGGAEFHAVTNISGSASSLFLRELKLSSPFAFFKYFVQIVSLSGPVESFKCTYIRKGEFPFLFSFRMVSLQWKLSVFKTDNNAHIVLQEA